MFAGWAHALEQQDESSFVGLASSQLFAHAVLPLLPPATLGCLACTCTSLRGIVASLHREAWVHAFRLQGLPPQHPLFR